MINFIELGSEIFRTGFSVAVFGYLWWAGRTQGSLPPRGWNALLGGFGLLVVGSLLDISDEFEVLNAFIIVGNTPMQALLEKAVVFPLGYLLLLLGLMRWMPAVRGLSQEVEYRKQAERALEAKVESRTGELRAANLALAAEVAMRKRAQESLEIARARLEHLLTASPAVIYSCEPNGDYGNTFVSDNVQALVGYQPKDFTGDSRFWINHVHPRDREWVMTALGTLLQRGEARYEYRFRHQDGGYRWIHDELQLVRDSDGQPLELVGYWVDITDRKRAEQTRQRLSAILEASTDFVGYADHNGAVLYINQAGCEMVGITAEDAVGRPLTEFSPLWAQALICNEGLPEASRGGSWRGETALLHREGDEIPVSQLILAHHTPDGEVEFFSTVAQDISERKAYESHLQYQASYDGLTALPNRNLLQDRLEHAIAHARRAKQGVAVLFLDLDRFKMVNDSLGHNVGDALLKAVAERLRSCVRDEDTVSRLGGDEFVLVLEELAGGKMSRAIAGKVLAALQAPFALEGQTFCINASIGISLFPRDGHNALALLKSADTALHWAKAQGRGCIRGYTSEMNAQALERLTLEQSLRQALEREELVLHYQPIIDLQTGGMVAVEALLRWQHPQLGLVPPAKFIPLAEELGIMPAIGEWVLRTACLQARRWQEAELPALIMSVNLSTQQFIQVNLTERVAHILKETGLSPSCLAVEITESQLMQDVEGAVASLRAFRKMKVHLSIDDFGTGYSSLIHLKRFPLNRLKIGKDFIHDFTKTPEDKTIVLAVISLAHTLGLKVVAEGVETEEQLRFLQRHGCEEMQGHYFSPPLPALEMEALLQENRSLPLMPAPMPLGA